ncbi:MAG: hypothetical protein AAF541_10330 [Pseudomonadota bacterium]
MSKIKHGQSRARVATLDRLALMTAMTATMVAALATVALTAGAAL